jgi:uncharacterized protein involved in exopolysaccharide biosynthesis
LASIVTSESFFYEALGSGYRIDQNYFSARPDKRLKEWGKTVSADAINDTGIISVNVFHKDKYQAAQIAEAVNYILKTKNGLYHGGGDKVSVKVIDPPIVSRFPVKPNIILNLSLAFALGLIFSLCYIYLLPEEKYDMRMLPKWRTLKKGNNNKEEAGALNRPYGQIGAIEEGAIREKNFLSDMAAAERIKEMDLEQDDEFDIAKRGDIRNIF